MDLRFRSAIGRPVVQVTSRASTRSDFLVIGGGIVGLTVALEISRRWPGTSIVLLEKEEHCGRHASGRNSGVLHSGMYYDEDSLKARFTVDGNRRLSEYCQERALPFDRCGKLVVTRHPSELTRLDELARRGQVNGVELHAVDERQASRIEPRARTFERALFSPSTAVVDPVAVVDALASDARAGGIAIHASTRYRARDDAGVSTNRGRYSTSYVVNAAGLHADRVAHDYGFGNDYRILPFKGLYLENHDPDDSVRVHVYPVPDPRFPFLGVHFTRKTNGGTTIGPTALPAFWREQYGGMAGFHLKDVVPILASEARMLLTNASGFRELARREVPKYSKRHLLRCGRSLIPDVGPAGRWRWGRPGIRAQLQHTGTRELVSDFVIEGDDRSMHVLNAVSPAFTCALPFAGFVVDEIDRRLTRRPAPVRGTSSADRAVAGPAQPGENQ